MNLLEVDEQSLSGLRPQEAHAGALGADRGLEHEVEGEAGRQRRLLGRVARRHHAVLQQQAVQLSGRKGVRLALHMTHDTYKQPHTHKRKPCQAISVRIMNMIYI